VAIGFGVVLSACGDDSSSEPTQGGTFRVGLSDVSKSKLADPQNAITSLDLTMAEVLYDSPLRQIRNGSYDFSACDELEPNADGSEWTFRVREGLEFQNGKTADADDLIFTVQRALDPKAPTYAAITWGWADPNALRKLDARTVRFTLKKPNAIVRPLMSNTDASLLPVGYDPNKPVGTGAFLFVSANPGQGAETAAFKNYWEGPPHLDKLEFVQFKDPAAELNAMLGGPIDGMDNINSDQLPSLEGQGDFTVISASTLGGTTRQIAMNTTVAPYDNNDVRQALRLLANRQQMVDQVFPDHAKLGNDVWVSADSPDYDSSLTQREQDVEQAKFLLQKAGAEDATFTLSAANVGAGVVATAEVYAGQANDAGINVKTSVEDPATYFAADYLSYPFFVSLGFGSYPYLINVNTFMLPTSLYPETSFDDPQYLKLYNQAVATLDDGKRAEIEHEMQQIEYDRGGYLLWAWPDQLSVVSNRFAGLETTNETGQPFERYAFSKIYEA
jgi:peptide/nickel transport system substrate-binding protein